MAISRPRNWLQRDLVRCQPRDGSAGREAGGPRGGRTIFAPNNPKIFDDIPGWGSTLLFVLVAFSTNAKQQYMFIIIMYRERYIMYIGVVVPYGSMYGSNALRVMGC